MQIEGKAVKTKGPFQMSVTVSIHITATPERIWAILTDANAFPRWNSTVKEVSGVIALGQIVSLKTTANPERTFKLKVTKADPGKLLVWQDGAAPMFKGVRTYTISKQTDGSSNFMMTETFTGLMLPLIAGSLPDFRPVFERYAADLKAEAERTS